MGCPSEVVIGDNLVFSICTHDPDTGVLTDTDSAPAYRVYEDETATAILTGTMAILDTANTTGFYTESVACTSANGFEDGKSYTIYIEAIVDSDKGGISYSFKAITNILDIAFTDATTLTANGLKDRIRTLMWIVRNKMEVTDANGNTTVYKDDSTTSAIQVNAALTDDSTTTTRLRMA